MKYMGMPFGMWLLYRKSFQHQLVAVLKLDSWEAKRVRLRAKNDYKAIIEGIPPFEKGDIFKMNIVSCALLSAFYRNLKDKPPLEALTVYYQEAMGIWATKWFCRKGGLKKFAEATAQKHRRVARENATPIPGTWTSFPMKMIADTNAASRVAAFAI